MPGEIPRKFGRPMPGGREVFRPETVVRQAAAALAFLVAMAALPGAAKAGASEFVWAGHLFSFAEVMLLAVFGGAMSFAILAASWLIRERGRMAVEASELKRRLADLRAANERSEALVNVTDQRIVVWNGAEAKPVILGRLSPSCGAPEGRGEFLAFGRWLSPDSAIGFEGVLKHLRADADAFDLPLVTRSGGVIEAQGRTSGGYAFVRFIELSGERMALSRLEADHARLHSLFDTVRELFAKFTAPVWLRDGFGALLWVNGAYAKSVDRADGEAVIREPVELLDAAERKRVLQSEAGAGFFQGALPAVVSGDRRMLDITEVRTASASAGIAIDRSETEAIAEKLSQTVAGHRRTLDHLSSAIAMFDSRQRLLFSNSAFARLWGFGDRFLAAGPTNAEILDALRTERKLPERPDWRKWRDAQLEVYRAIEPKEDIWHLSGGRTVRAIANPHPEGGATWVFQNVTEQLELQSNYNALMEVQGETLDHLSEAVAVFGQDGRLRLCNPAFVALWRLEPADAAAGSHIASLSLPCRQRLRNDDDWNGIADAVTGVDETRSARKGRVELREGPVLDYSLVPLPAGQSMLTFTDVTATVSVERALKDRNEALEQSDNLKNRFIRHVSYELRAPLTSIAGFSELMAMGNIGKLNPKQAEYLGHVVSASGVLKTLIDDILDLATIDAGAMALDITPAPLQPAIDSCLAALGERMSQRRLQAEIALGDGANVVRADQERLRQILYNLLSNAVAASPDGGRIGITSSLRGDALELAVADEGPVVAEADRGRLFGRFEQRSGDGPRRGSGLGLSIVKSLVELHGGTVEVENPQGGGARFVLRMPDQGGARAA